MTKTPHEPQAVWETLKRGNARFRDHISEHPHADTERRYALRSGQAPRAVVLACSDSRVPVELVFDCGLGDLFVVRTAGEILDSAVLGSIEFAVRGLGVDLLVVLGHESCGAVAAARGAVEEGEVPGGWQRTLVEKVAPALMTSRAQGRTDPADYERAHVSAVVDQLHHRVEGLDELIAENRLGVVGLRYLLSDSGLEVVEAHGVEA
ncbi:beta-hydroxylase [Corynebacterium frankenforstense DSM 45800]|uniref:Carbonic anhydrase n=2 Tax=Corynebacterium TaxID=1716 RepID=A0A1L7CUR7_9CORY|nr:beta-hydroxylase [Corynebacterium frankenforstense DSM 45800]